MTVKKPLLSVKVNLGGTEIAGAPDQDLGDKAEVLLKLDFRGW